MFRFYNFTHKRTWLAVFSFFIQSNLCLADTPRETASSPIVSEEVPRKEIQHRTEKIFRELNQDAGIVWNLALTPVFPNNWPPNSSTVWIRYAYARGQEFPPKGLSDGEKISSPFLQIEFHPNTASATLISLSDSLKEVGIQGIRPLYAEEIKIFKSQTQIEDTILSREVNFDPNLSGVRDFYRLWIQTNGVIAEELRFSHDAFFKWIETKTE